VNDPLADLHPEGPITSAEDNDLLEATLRLLLRDGAIEEVAVTERRYRFSEEHWYRTVSAGGAIYRYVAPNFPARGRWEQVRR
jgi:hypothetical protein